jgi:hypothetical protein
MLFIASIIFINFDGLMMGALIIMIEFLLLVLNGVVFRYVFKKNKTGHQISVYSAIPAVLIVYTPWLLAIMIMSGFILLY